MHIKDVLRKPCIHCPIVATAEVKVNSGLDKEFDRCKKKTGNKKSNSTILALMDEEKKVICVKMTWSHVPIFY